MVVLAAKCYLGWQFLHCFYFTLLYVFFFFFFLLYLALSACAFSMPLGCHRCQNLTTAKRSKMGEGTHSLLQMSHPLVNGAWPTKLHWLYNICKWAARNAQPINSWAAWLQNDNPNYFDQYSDSIISPTGRSKRLTVTFFVWCPSPITFRHMTAPHCTVWVAADFPDANLGKVATQ